MTVGALETSLKRLQSQFSTSRAAEWRVMEQYRKIPVGIRSLDSSAALPVLVLVMLGKSANPIAFLLLFLMIWKITERNE